MFLNQGRIDFFTFSQSGGVYLFLFLVLKNHGVAQTGSGLGLKTCCHVKSWKVLLNDIYLIYHRVVFLGTFLFLAVEGVLSHCPWAFFSVSCTTKWLPWTARKIRQFTCRRCPWTCIGICPGSRNDRTCILGLGSTGHTLSWHRACRSLPIWRTIVVAQCC